MRKTEHRPGQVKPIRGGFFFPLKAIMFCDRLCLHHVQCTRNPFPEHLISVNMALYMFDKDFLHACR